MAETLQNEGREDLTAPFLVVCDKDKASFDKTLLNEYTYQVIGGVQRYNAILKVNESATDKKITTRKCSVYGSGMSNESILTLAQDHNSVNQVQRVTTFPEVAMICRRLLFKHFACEGQEDDGEYSPVVPRYNSNDYREWKRECLLYCVNSKVVSMHSLHIAYDDQGHTHFALWYAKVLIVTVIVVYFTHAQYFRHKRREPSP